MRITGVSSPTRPFKENEDWLGSAPDTVVVLDGCGHPDALGEIDHRCVHGTPWYVRALGTALLRGASDSATPLDDALASAIAETASAHHGRCDLSWPASPSSTVLVLRQSHNGVEYLVLGDSTIVVDDGGAEPIVLTDDRMSRVELPPRPDRASSWYLDETRGRVEQLHRMRNQPDGYPIAQSDPSAAYKAMVGHLDTDRLRHALLVTDGAARGVEVFGEFGWGELLGLAEREGPEAVIARTRELEESDPESQQWPRGKVHDDATAAYCTFEQCGVKQLALRV